jgi:ribosome-binding ATPase YchF (GTP1/OBG family)
VAPQPSEPTLAHQDPTPARDGRVGLGSLGRLMERFGLVGLPNAGKSSLYNALTGGGALAAPYAFATKDPNIGVAKVPDDRLDRLAEMSKSKKTIHAAVEVVDIGGLVEGASKGEGLGNKFLANIREVDAIVFVLRAFVDDDVTGPSDPLEHLRVVEIELALADLETVEKRLHQTTAPGQARQVARPTRLAALADRLRRAVRGSAALPRRPEGRRTVSARARTSC